MSEIILRERMPITERRALRGRRGLGILPRTLDNLSGFIGIPMPVRFVDVDATQADPAGSEAMQAIIAKSQFCPDKLLGVFRDDKFQVFTFLKRAGQLACDETCNHEKVPADPIAEVLPDQRAALAAEQPISGMIDAQNSLQTS